MFKQTTFVLMYINRCMRILLMPVNFDNYFCDCDQQIFYKKHLKALSEMNIHFLIFKNIFT